MFEVAVQVKRALPPGVETDLTATEMELSGYIGLLPANNPIVKSILIGVLRSTLKSKITELIQALG